MNSISLDQLTDFREDAVGLRDFQRPYLLPSLLGLALALIGFFLMISAMEASHLYRGQTPNFLQQTWIDAQSVALKAGWLTPIPEYAPMLLFFGAVLFLALTMLVMGRSTPVSRATGEKLEKYWNADAPSGDREIIYVDRAARTYFRRVFMTRSAPRVYTPAPR